MRKSVPSVLERTTAPPYPSEYLISRLKGRSAYLIEEWGPIVYSERPSLPQRYGEYGEEPPMDAVNRTLRREFRWVYFQMNEKLRNSIMTIFEYFELKTIFALIRYKSGRRTGELQRKTLSDSLLSQDLKKLLLEAETQEQAYDIVLEAFGFNNKGKRPQSLQSPYSGWLRDAERSLTEKFIEHASATGIHPEIQWFFRYIIDMRNIISAYKHARWNIQGPVRLIEGGTINQRIITSSLNEQALSMLVQKLTSIETESITNIEGVLVKGLLKHSTRMARTGTPETVILDYLLKCHYEARNISILLSSTSADRARLREEMAV